MRLKVLSPSRTLLDLDVQTVELPGTVGRFVVLKGHAPLVSSLQKGSVRYVSADGSRGELPVEDGFVRVKDEVVTVCVG